MTIIMNKVLFIDKAHPILEKGLQGMGYRCEDISHLDRESTKRLLADAFGLVIRSRLKMDEDLLQHASSLKFIARTGIGLEHVDLDYTDERGIKVFNSPEGSRVTVGEHAVGLLLSLMNHLAWADHEVRSGKWIREANRGTEIKGKTIGVIGYGNTGQAFAKRMSGFEARVLAYDKFKENYGDEYAKAVSLEEIQEEADIVSFHIPYSSENHYLVGKTYLEAFQKPIFLVNTSRGLILNTADLVEQMEKGKVRGAALDVLEYEEMSFAHLALENLPTPFQYLRKAKNAVLNPHIAGWSHEAKKAHAEVLLQKIYRCFD